MDQLEKAVKRIIFKYGYCEVNWPIMDELSNFEGFRKIIEQLSSKKEIYLLNDNPDAFLNKECYLNHKKLEFFENSLENDIDKTSEIFKITKYDNIIFDLGGVIVDESELDVLICDYFDSHIKKGNFKWKSYDEFSNFLIKNNDVRWYDYFYQAKYFNIKKHKIIKLHQDNSHLVNIYPYSLEFLKLLKNQGKKIFLVTGCNSNILELRLKIYGLDNFFIECITSDKVNDITDKELYYKYLIKNKKIDPSNSIIITDNYFKDCLPGFINGLECLLFYRGGRKNKKYFSHGIQPSKIYLISNMVYSRRTELKYIFSSFKQLFKLFKTV